jgi:hypothetical protein
VAVGQKFNTSTQKKWSLSLRTDILCLIESECSRTSFSILRSARVSDFLGLKMCHLDWSFDPSRRSSFVSTFQVPTSKTIQEDSMAPGIELNKYSAQITVPKSQGNAQAMLYATGIKDEAQMQLPQIGISSVWWEGNPCISPSRIN